MFKRIMITKKIIINWYDIQDDISKDENVIFLLLVQKVHLDAFTKHKDHFSSNKLLN